MKKIERKMIYSKSGITLMALVITIIVLLILAGVSLNAALGENGIITRAEKAVKQSEAASERERIQMQLLANQMENTKEQEIGKKLYDKTVENGNRWNIIVEKETNKVYGTGWTFVSEDMNIGENVTAKSNWLINDETGEMIELGADEFIELSYATALGTTNGLIFNIDSTMIENGDKDSITSQLGSNVELMNFDWTEESGLTTNSFNLDGVDDYIKIKYDSEEEKQKLAENGFTFEFYGILNEGNSYKNTGELFTNTYSGIFCYWNGDESKQASLRFGLHNRGETTTDRYWIFWNAGYGDFVSDYSHTSSWNIQYITPDFLNKEHYITISLDTSNSYTKDDTEYYTHTLYIDGEKLYTGGYNKNTWDYFINNELQSLNYFALGRSSMNHHGEWHYSKMNTYALRLYNRGLSEEEVIENYDKSVAYRNAILQQ